MFTPSTLEKFPKNLITLAIVTAFSPQIANALVLVEEPPIPKSTSTYVAPNVILSLDDSTSMEAKDMIKNTKTRVQVLKDALTEVFKDETLLPDGKIRFAWHSFGMQPEGGGWKDCTSVKGFNLYRLNADSAKESKYTNTMRILDKTHRSNFLKYVNAFTSCSSTPTHWMIKGADDYMRAPLHINGPWADKPGQRLASEENGNKPLGCRRNYHILLTDGDWNGDYTKKYPVNTSPVNFDNQDSKKNIHGKEGTSNETEEFNPFKLPDGTEYNRDDPNTWVYRDIDFPTWSSWHPGYKGQYLSSLSDWSFKSWATELQSPSKLKGKLSPLTEYLKAPATETFTNPKTKKTATLEKYWNPRYDPATWPHMVTYTIGFSKDSIPTKQYRPMGNNSQAEKNIGLYWMDKKVGNEWFEKKDGLIWQYDGPELADTTNTATNNGNEGALIKPTTSLPYGYDGSFADYAAGRAQWYSVMGGGASQDMWHAAINGRGKFYPVERGEDLKLAFQEIINSINEENAPLPGEVHATNTSTGFNTTQNNAGNFISGYSPKDNWRGWVQASSAKEPEEVDCGDNGEKCTLFPSIIKDWDGKTTAQHLDALADSAVKDGGSGRAILTWNDAIISGTGLPVGGAAFKWSDDQDNENYLSNTQKALLGKSGNITGVNIKEKGENILNYIRGDNTFAGSEDEENIDTSKPFRKRVSRQGDIVNSQIWYTQIPVGSTRNPGYSAFIKENRSREGMLYVGGNDGMLHGFSAKNGREKFAYIPRGVIYKLKDLSNPAYSKNHQYYVDGSPMTGDVKTGSGATSNDWKTFLVGTLGAGGKGYFVLDVTKPDNFSENNASSIVVMDKTFAKNETTTGVDDDIGYITANPEKPDANIPFTSQITKLNNDRWAVVLGNGYNSKNQRPALLIQYLDQDKELISIPATLESAGTGNAEDNGLSAPTLMDVSGDAIPDVAYAGDNRGNLWRFNLLSKNSSEWGVAFNGNPLFIARGKSTAEAKTRDAIQPITVAPLVKINNRKKIIDIGGGQKKSIAVSGFMIAFGTGRNLSEDDRSTNKNYPVQTFYSVLDNTRYKLDSNKNLIIDEGSASCVNTSTVTCISAPKTVGTMGGDAKLVERKMSVYINTLNNKEERTIDDSENLDWNTYNGWYVDLPKERERLLKPVAFYGKTNLTVFQSEYPTGTSTTDGSNATDVEHCGGTSVDISQGKQYINILNIMDGKRSSFPLFVYNGYDGYDPSKNKMTIGGEIKTGTPSQVNDGKGIKHNASEITSLPPEKTTRPSWRQIR